MAEPSRSSLRHALGFLPPDLRRFDELETEVLALPFFADRRPLRGAVGLVDWRMRGFLSKLLIRGRIDGAAGEHTLLPSAGRLPVDKLLLIGLGPTDRFDAERFDEVTRGILETLTRARIRSCALELPGRGVGAIGPEDAMERFLHAARPFAEIDELILVESLVAQRAMEPVLERERRRSRAVHG